MKVREAGRMFRQIVFGSAGAIAKSWKRGLLVGLCLGLVALYVAIPGERAKAPDPIGAGFHASKAEEMEEAEGGGYQALLRLREQRAALPRTTKRSSSASYGGTWQVVTALPDDVGLGNPLLLTDGTVIASNVFTSGWYRLTPDLTGNYANGTWSAIASLPLIGGQPYDPAAFASAVLPDGRVIIMGGEYLGSDSNHQWTPFGAIYDPLADQWTPVPAPPFPFWREIGDAPAVVLANGTFLLGNCCSEPSVDALFNASTLSWTSTGAPNGSPNTPSGQGEQGYELLPDGSVMTIEVGIDALAGAPPPTQAFRYIPASGTWTPAGNVPVSLVSPGSVACGNEMGPAVLRTDGTLVAFGGYMGGGIYSNCDIDEDPVPTAIYNSTNGAWSAGPYLPAACGAAGTDYCTLPDAPAALLPNGNILFAAGAAYGSPPTHFFEFTPANTISQVADTVDFSAVTNTTVYNFLVLPSGQILSTDFSNIAEVYTPTGSADPSWAPVIATAPATIVAGASYPISGKQFNGLSQGGYFGDDFQMATNYPIVQVTNAASNHVFYARTFNHSTMSIAPNAAGSTNFTVPANIEPGPSTLVVIANGIASQPVSLVVQNGSAALVASVLPSSRSVPVGTAATVFATVINSGAGALDNCQIALMPLAPAGLTVSYQATSPATNAPIGAPNTPVSIAGNDGAQSFIVSFTGSAGFSAPGLPLDFACDGTSPAAIVPGIDTIDLTVSTTPTADVIAVAATLSNDGIVHLSGGSGVFAVASDNIGVADQITAAIDYNGATLPVAAVLCQTNPSNGQCLATPASSVTVGNFANGATPTFSIFLTATGAIPFNPGSSRAFFRLLDAGGAEHGATSVALETE